MSVQGASRYVAMPLRTVRKLWTVEGAVPVHYCIMAVLVESPRCRRRCLVCCGAQEFVVAVSTLALCVGSLSH